jgi:hypothetical protein
MASLEGVDEMRFDELVQKYIALRDKKSKLKAAYDSKVSEIDNLLGRLEGVILTTFQQTGMDSVRTAAGTAYRTTRTSATVADWDALRAFIKANDPELTFIERRVNKTAVEQFRAANDDIPPGVNFREEIVINVRRSA